MPEGGSCAARVERDGSTGSAEIRGEWLSNEAVTDESQMTRTDCGSQIVISTQRALKGRRIGRYVGEERKEAESLFQSRVDAASQEVRKSGPSRRRSV